ncbi:hypothetical protein niasHT_001388 [Heterodera trifolii]|uniref:Secreted protein n=1 Tax=Heterodera trifolii TaxID=157864 RepID=A0ABD2LN24_9BILA
MFAVCVLLMRGQATENATDVSRAVPIRTRNFAHCGCARHALANVPMVSIIMKIMTRSSPCDFTAEDAEAAILGLLPPQR